MPLMNKNYVTPAWIDNAAPPINDDELNAMSETLEGSQILVGNGAPTSSTQGKVGQRYADISTTPATIYQVESVTPSAIPQKAYTDAGGLLIGYRKNNGTIVSEIRVSSSLDKDVFLFLQSASNTVITLYAFCRTSNARVREEDSSQTISWTLNTRTQDRDWYYGVGTISWSESQEYETTMLIPEYPTFSDMLDVLNNPSVPTWKAQADPNRNLARPYSTGSSYAAGDYCIHDGKLWRALEATGGAWDGSKWEQAKYADDLSGHEADQNNPHNVTAAQTGAVSPPVLATVQATTAAVRDYYAGEYFFYEGQLYVLREAVNQGGKLVIGGADAIAIYKFDQYYPSHSHSSRVPSSPPHTPSEMYYSRVQAQSPFPIIPTGAKYLYWIPDNDESVWVVMFSTTEADINNAAYETGRILPGKPLHTLIWFGPSSRTAGSVYYFTRSDIFFTEDNYALWPDDAVMFRGSETQLQQFLSENPDSANAEPAVLGDGIAELGPKTGSVSLSATWEGSDPYSQTVTLSGATVTGKSKVDLLPTAAQLDALATDGVISLMIENNGGTLTAWAVGGTPSTAMTISCTVTETV